MRAKPAFFSKTNVGPGSGPGTPINVCDALHAWKLLSFIKRESESNRLNSKRKKEDLARPMRLHTAVGAAPAQAGIGNPTATDDRLRPFDEVFGYTLEEAAMRHEAFEKGPRLASEADRELARVEALVEEVSGVNIKMMGGETVQGSMQRRTIGLGERLTVVKALTMGPDGFLHRCVTRKAPGNDNSGANLPGLNDETCQGDALAAAEDNTLTGSDAVTETELNRVAEVRLNMHQGTARAPPLADACKVIGIDPTKLEVSPKDHPLFRLKAHQVTGVMWMQQQEAGPIHGGILADDCGLGKTLQALTLIWSRAGRKRSETGRWGPTLIIAPTTVIPVWIREATHRFGDDLTLKLFYWSSEHATDKTVKNLTINDRDLILFLEKLDWKDPQTSRTIVLTSYETWSARTIVEAGKSTDPVAPEIEEAGEIQDRIGTSTSASRDKSRWNSSVAGQFLRVVLDEGHKAKNILSRVHQSIRLLNAKHVWVLTATPMLNQMIDLCGPLALLNNDGINVEARRELADSGGDALRVYLDAEEKYKADPNTDLSYLLSPKLFAAIAHRHFLGALSGFHGLPLVLRQIALARSNGDPVDPSTATGEDYERIGDDIPPMTFETIDLKYSTIAQQEHDEA
ncbi:P-loop containing nucleoside triphosphate hydrolase protein, partial [Aspergillus granulosus]